MNAWRERQLFEPGALGWCVNPFFFARRGLLAGLKEYFPQLGGDVLDVGCGRKPYRRFVSAKSYVGVDVDTPETRSHGDVDVYYDGRTLPFADSSFDSVLCSQVFEHVFTPQQFLAEIHRVLRPGGSLLLTVPFLWDEHEQPHDYARYASFGLKAALQQAGFEIVGHHKTCADFRAIVQLTSGSLYKATRTRHRALNFAAQLALIAPVNALGGLFAAVLPGNPDLYLDNIVLARKPGRPS